MAAPEDVKDDQAGFRAAHRLQAPLRTSVFALILVQRVYSVARSPVWSRTFTSIGGNKLIGLEFAATGS